MAIRFLNALNIDGTITATINQDANSGYDGILVSTSGLIERRTKAQILSDIGAGTMSSFTVSADTNTATTTITNGETLSLVGGTGVSTVSNPDGTITITATGSSYSGWTLAGDSGSSQDIASGNTVTIAGGDIIDTVVGATDTLTINHGAVSRNDTTSTASPGYGGTVDVVNTITTTSEGHVSAVDIQTITFPSAENYSWTLTADSGSNQTISSGNTVDISGTANNISTVVGATDKVTIDLIDTGVSAGAYTSADVTVDAKGRVTAISNGGAGTMSSWTLAGDGGSNQTISDGNTATFAGGTGISTAGSATDTLTITNDLPFNSITLAATTGSDSTISNNGTITIAAGANLTATKDGSGQVTIAYTGGTGSMSSWTVAGDSGSSSVSNGQTVTIAGSGTGATAGIDTSESGRTVTVSLDLNEITTASTIDGDNDSLVFYDSNNNGNRKITPDDIHLDQWGDAEADVAFGGNKLTGVGTGTAGTDGVNLAQVQSIAAGVGVFQGGYNASTNSPALTGGSNIALDQGDFFVVTTAGSFFTENVEVGDLIFANSAIAASSSPSLSDYTVVIADENIAGVGATDGATEKGVAGFDNAVFTATANGWIQLIDQGITAGSYGSASKTVTVNFDKFGVAQSAAQQDIDITASQVSDFCTAVSTCIAANEQYAADIGGATSIAVNHGLGTRDVIVQLYDNATYDTVYADVTRNTTGQVTVDFTSAPGANAIRILITKVS